MIAGPYNVTGPGDTPSRAQIFVCQPANAGDEEPCARKILANLGRRAFRRPVTDADLQAAAGVLPERPRAKAISITASRRRCGRCWSPRTFCSASSAIRADAAPGRVYRVSDFELASRLSFFLWSSIPDEELLDLAEQGKLKDPAVLEQQVRRMLADPRPRRWSQFRRPVALPAQSGRRSKPDPDTFPNSMRACGSRSSSETELFFEQHPARESQRPRSARCRTTRSSNQRLAEHYGIPNVYGSQFRRVDADRSEPRRPAGQGSILTVTSYPNRTSVVQRGKWVLENLLGTPPPPPPPDVPGSEAHGKDGKLLTMREQMEQHRANPICASCHSRMDPHRLRARELRRRRRVARRRMPAAPIDASGKLPDGTTVRGPGGLKKLLLTAASRRVRRHRHREAADVRLGPRPGVLRSSRPSRAIMREAARDRLPHVAR